MGLVLVGMAIGAALGWWFAKWSGEKDRVINSKPDAFYRQKSNGQMWAVETTSYGTGEWSGRKLFVMNPVHSSDPKRATDGATFCEIDFLDDFEYVPEFLKTEGDALLKRQRQSRSGK